MPIVLLTVGALFIISSLNGKEHDLATQIYKDFSGDDSFVYWIVAIVIIGGVGYIPGWGDVSNLFMALIIIVFILANNGVFTKLEAAL